MGLRPGIKRISLILLFIILILSLLIIGILVFYPALVALAVGIGLLDGLLGIIQILLQIANWVYKPEEIIPLPFGVSKFQTIFPVIPEDKPVIVRDWPRLADFESGFVVKSPETHQKIADLLYVKTHGITSEKITKSQTQERFRAGVLAGPSGCGKTVTSLKFGYDLIKEKWEVFFCEAADAFTTNNLAELRKWILSLKGKNILIVDNTHLKFEQIEALSQSLTTSFNEGNSRLPSSFRLLCIYSNIHIIGTERPSQVAGSIGGHNVVFVQTALDDKIGLAGLSIAGTFGTREILKTFSMLQISEGREIAETVFEKFQEVGISKIDFDFRTLFEHTGTVVELCEVLRTIRDGTATHLPWESIPVNALTRRALSTTDKELGVLILGIVSVFSQAGSIVSTDFISKILSRNVSQTVDELVLARHVLSRNIGESLREHLLLSHPIVASLIRQGSSDILGDLLSIDESLEIDIYYYRKYLEHLKSMPRTAVTLGSAFLLALSTYSIVNRLDTLVELVIQECNDYHEKDRNIAMSLYNASSHYLKKNQLSEAEALLLETINLVPDFVQAKVNLSVVYYFKGEFPKAREILEDIPEDQRDVLAWANLGLVFHEMGEYEQGIVYLKKAIDLAPNEARYYHNLAKIEANANKNDDAVKHFLKAIELEPDNAEYYASLSSFYIRQGLNKKAEELLQDAKNRSIVTCKILINLGVAFKNQGQQKEAKELFNECIEHDPTNSLAHTNIADILVKEGNRDDALEHLREAIKHDTEFGPAYALMGLIYQEKHRWQKAKKAYETAISKGHETYDVVRNLAFVYYELKNQRIFDKKIEHAIELIDNQGIVWLDVALYLTKKNPKKSKELHSRVTNFLNECMKRGDWEKAEELLTKLTSLYPNQFQLWANLGVALACLDKPNEAKEALEKARDLKSSDPFVWHHLGNVYDKLGLTVESKEAYAKAAKLSSKLDQGTFFDPDRGWNLTS